MSNDLSQTKWRIGIYPGPPEIRMEEEEEPETRTWDYGRTERIDEVAKHNIDELLRQRALIIGSMDIAKLSAEEKFKLLEETRLVIAQLYPARFKTEKVIYSILGSLTDRFTDHLSQVFRLRFFHAGTICRGRFRRL
jgi:hypothetical protein